MRRAQHSIAGLRMSPQSSRGVMTTSCPCARGRDVVILPPKSWSLDDHTQEELKYLEQDRLLVLLVDDILRRNEDSSLRAWERLIRRLAVTISHTSGECAAKDILKEIQKTIHMASSPPTKRQLAEINNSLLLQKYD